MVVAPGQQVVYTSAPTVAEDGQVVYSAAPAVAEGGQVVYAAPPVEGVEGAQMIYAAPPPVVQYEAPGRINVSHELFAKLAAGGALTPEEIAQLEGTMPAVEAAVAAVEEPPAPEAAAAGAEAAADP